MDADLRTLFTRIKKIENKWEIIQEEETRLTKKTIEFRKDFWLRVIKNGKVIYFGKDLKQCIGIYNST